MPSQKARTRVYLLENRVDVREPEPAKRERLERAEVFEVDYSDKVLSKPLACRSFSQSFRQIFPKLRAIGFLRARAESTDLRKLFGDVKIRVDEMSFLDEPELDRPSENALIDFIRHNVDSCKVFRFYFPPSERFIEFLHEIPLKRVTFVIDGPDSLKRFVTRILDQGVSCHEPDAEIRLQLPPDSRTFKKWMMGAMREKGTLVLLDTKVLDSSRICDFKRQADTKRIDLHVEFAEGSHVSLKFNPIPEDQSAKWPNIPETAKCIYK